MARYALRPKRHNKALVCAALVFLGACATVPPPPPPVPVMTVEMKEAAVWLDVMPNAKHLGYASYILKLTNTTDSTLTVTSIEGYLAPAHGGPAFRRFSITAQKDGQPVLRIELLPGLTYEYKFTSSAGFVPFDPARYPEVTAGITFTASTGAEAAAERTPIPVLITH